MTSLRALTTNVSVEIDDATPLASAARALIASFPPGDGAELVYELTATELRRDGVRIPVDHPEDLVPAFELDFYRQVGTRAAPGWLLHAACVEVSGRALVLCGPSGAGKTTLSLALTMRGFRLLTEEMVWISREGQVRGLPRAIHVMADSPQRARIPSSWQQVPYPIREPSGIVHEHVLVALPRDVLVLDERPLAAIVRLGHGPGWQVHLERSPQSVALQRLWDRSLRHDETGLAVATEVLRRYPSFLLSSTTETEALELLEPLLK